MVLPGGMPGVCGVMRMWCVKRWVIELGTRVGGTGGGTGGMVGATRCDRRCYPGTKWINFRGSAYLCTIARLPVAKILPGHKTSLRTSRSYVHYRT
jgi:hypothetical protein